MPEWRFVVNIEKDGVALADFPVIRRYIQNEDAAINQVFAPDNNSSTFHPVAAAIMPALGVIYLQFDQAINLQLNANSPLPMNANGFVLIVGANLTQNPPDTNVEINNPAATGGVSVNLIGLVSGS